jgi:hypothetical protein
MYSIKMIKFFLQGEIELDEDEDLSTLEVSVTQTTHAPHRNRIMILL